MGLWMNMWCNRDGTMGVVLISLPERGGGMDEYHPGLALLSPFELGWFVLSAWSDRF